MKHKFKNNDCVKIVSNDLEPQTVGKVGRIKKVYSSFSESGMGERVSLYRVEIEGTVLKGIAFDSDLELAK